jgi:hypothetical protein
MDGVDRHGIETGVGIVRHGWGYRVLLLCGLEYLERYFLA